ncbi:MAG: MotA/TolQ/ExbB proton channel family protein [bacterium]|nr:MotA/TolQ/ExbB proton channel family protein [bacterium]
MWEYFSQGGPVMWPLLLASVLTISLSFDRFYHLWRARGDGRGLMDRVRTVMQSGDSQAAVDICRKGHGPAAAMLCAGLEAVRGGDKAFERAVAETGNRELFRLERHLDTLSFVANAAPLLGLLGTVMGLVRIFNVFARQASPDTMALAGGIGEVLTATATGLMIAVVATVAHHFFSRQVDEIMAEAENLTYDLAGMAGLRDHAA